MTRYWFISTKNKMGSVLALVTFLLAFVVIILGGYTRLSDAGLSCPDWPHCYGYITAPHTSSQLEESARQYPLAPVNVKKAWTEMTHRYAAGLEGVLILVFAFTVLFARRAREAKSIIIGVSLIGLLIVQVMLGMLTVTEKLKPVIVLSHLLTGLSLLSLLWLAYLNLNLHDNFTAKRSCAHLIPWLWLAMLIIISQITLGGWVSTHYAGLACVDFPYCNGQLLPALQWDNLQGDLITIHMLHRLAAMVTGLYIGIMGLFLLKNASFRSMALLLLALISLQVTLGVLNIIWLRPVWIASIHQTVAIFLLLTILSTLVKAYFESRDHRYAFWTR